MERMKESSLESPLTTSSLLFLPETKGCPRINLPLPFWISEVDPPGSSLIPRSMGATRSAWKIMSLGFRVSMTYWIASDLAIVDRDHTVI